MVKPKKGVSIPSIAATAALSIGMVTSQVPTTALAEALGEGPATEATTVAPAASESASVAEPESAAGADASAGSDVEAGDADATEPATAAEPSTVAAPATADAPARAAAPNSLSTVYVNASTGNDDNDGTSATTALKTIDAALAAVADGGTINTVGSFSIAGSTIDKNVNFKGAGTSVAGGITLTAGTLAAPGKTVTMSDYKTALTVKAGATLGDGTWNLSGNGTGLYNYGAVSGSSREACKIVADCSGQAMEWAGASSYSRCTLDIHTAIVGKGGGYGTLRLSDVAATMRGYYCYALEMDFADSDVTWSDPNYTLKWGFLKQYYNMVTMGQEGSATGTSTIARSRVTFDNYRISTLHENLSITDGSVVTFKNAAGGFNVTNAAHVTVTDSKLVAGSGNSYALYGSRDGSNVTIQGNSTVDTAMKSASVDNGGVDDKSSYVVLGGSFAIKYSEGEYYFNGGYIGTTPTNGADHGNESLTWFKLSDPSVTSLDVVDANSATYAYPVANPSPDGNKYVWVPAAKVTFSLANPDATFADGTTADKSSVAMRGQAVSAATMANEKNVEAVPADPTSTSAKFLGWFYKDANGAEQKYDPAAPVTSDLSVYAKWDETVTAATDLPADLWSDTGADQSSAVREVNPGETFSLTGAIATAGVKQQMADIENQFGHGAGDAINLTDTECTFVATLTLPDGVTVPADAAATLEGQGDGFSVVSTEVSGQTVKVTMRLDASKAPTYAKLKALVDSMDDQIRVTVPGLAVGALLDNGTTLTATGTVTGCLTSTASLGVAGQGAADAIAAAATGNLAGAKKFDLTWNGVQSDAGRDAAATDAKAIQYTMRVVAPVSNVLDADLMVGSNTEHDRPIPVLAGETVDLTGAINVAPVATQMRAIEALYPNTDPATLVAAVENCTFVATITVPDGMTIPADAQATPENFGDAFEVVSTKVEGNKATVTMRLKDGMTTYAQIQKAVSDVADANGGWMKVTIPGVKVGAAVAPGAKLTSVGTVAGEFKGSATNPAGTTHSFWFKWTGSQVADGRDAVATDDDTIQLTCQTVAPIASTLPGDLKVDGDTESSALPWVNAGATLTYAADLDVSGVKRQMEQVEQNMGSTSADRDSIALTGTTSTFAVTLTAPDGVTLPADASAYTLAGTNAFTVADVTVTGNKVTITLQLAEAYDTYGKLYQAIHEDTADTLTLTVADAKVADDASGTKTLTGTVDGTMSARATLGQKSEPFAFAWSAEQMAGKADFLGYGPIAVSVGVREPLGLEGDLLVAPTGTDAFDSEHDAVYRTKAGSTLDYRANLDVAPIKQKMDDVAEQIKREYNRDSLDFSQIELSGLTSTFTATFDVPEGLTFPTDASAYSLTGTSAFKISDVRAEGSKMVLTMQLDASKYPTYEQLYQAIHEDTADTLSLTATGVKVADGLAAGTRLTVTGAVDGSMQSMARCGGVSKGFGYTWSATQQADGTDATLAVGDSSIKLTVEIAAEPTFEPDPTTPGEQDKPSKPGDSTKPATTVTPSTTVTPTTGDAAGALPALLTSAGAALMGLAAAIDRKMRSSK